MSFGEQIALKVHEKVKLLTNKYLNYTSCVSGIVAVFSKYPINADKKYCLSTQSIKQLEFKVISVGYGTQAVSFTKSSSKAHTAFSIPDLHAEVLSRRAFKAGITEEMYKSTGIKDNGCFSENIHLFTRKNNLNDKLTPTWVIDKYYRERHIEFHLYTSQLPCGACSVYRLIDSAMPTKGTQRNKRERPQMPIQNLIRKGTGAPAIISKNIKVDYRSTINYSDLIQPHNDLTTVSGRLHFKPGRGTPSLCMSCSDKICKWQAVGLEGNLLNYILFKSPDMNLSINPPFLFLSSITVPSTEYMDETYIKESLEISLNDRISKINGKTLLLHSVDCSKLSHYYTQELVSTYDTPNFNTNTLPLNYAFAWHYGLIKPIFLNTKDGFPQGATKKVLFKSHNSDISNFYQLMRFKQLYSYTTSQLDISINALNSFMKAKCLNQRYLNAKKIMKKNQLFENWIEKEREDFTLEDFM